MKRIVKNLAGDANCDIDIVKELELAGIPYHRFGTKMGGEVPSHIVGFLNGWKFERAWYYWVAKGDDNLLLFEHAEPLHEKFGSEVRVSGHCGCPSPKKWFDKPYHIGVSFYHIDSQDGLNALAAAIKDQAGGHVSGSE